MTAFICERESLLVTQVPQAERKCEGGCEHERERDAERERERGKCEESESKIPQCV